MFDEQMVNRFHLPGEPDPAVLCTPTFIAFDVLQAGQRDVRPMPFIGAGTSSRRR